MSFVSDSQGGGAKTGITRPSQLLQMMRDFVNGYGFNNCLANVPKAAQPLLPQYQNIAKTQSRKDAALVKYSGVFILTWKIDSKSSWAHLRHQFQAIFWISERCLQFQNPLLVISDLIIIIIVLGSLRLRRMLTKLH